MAIIGDKDAAYLRDLFGKKLKGDVNLILFVSDSGECQLCDKTVELMKEVAALNEKIKLTIYDIKKNEKEAKFLEVDKVPALIIGGKKIYPAYYFGMPYGHEFAALVNDILVASNSETTLKESTKEKIRSVNKKLNVMVFVTPTCPYCPIAVHMAHQFAMENSNIKAQMIEALEFPELADKYEVMAVPKIVINDTVEFEGAVPEEMFLEYLDEAVKKS